MPSLYHKEEAMTEVKKATRMSFYATGEDQRIMDEIKKLAPHYSFNHATREGHRALLRSLQMQARATQRTREVEYT